MALTHNAPRRIQVIYTGGTVGMVPDARTNALVPGGLDDLLEHAPHLRSMPGVALSFATLEPPVDSSDMGPAQWRRLAAAIADGYDAHDGFVVLHGTDTMAYTASALSFMVQNLAKPVVLTGSQLPIAQAGSDAPRNLRDAVAVSAAIGPDGASALQEVAVCFGGRVLRGNRSVKASSTDFAAFDSPNLAPLGHVTEDGAVKLHGAAKPAGEAAAGPAGGHAGEADAGPAAEADAGTSAGLEACLDLEPAVAAVWVHPGLDAKQLRAQLETPGLKGAVLLTYGAGNVPTDAAFSRTLREAAERGLLLTSVTQCAHGGQAPGRYAASEALADAGVVSGADMTPEAALAKTMHLLGRGLDMKEAAPLMQTPLAGELTVR